MQRTALRHFVGNRDQLTSAAIVEITRRALVDLDTPLTLGELTAMLFNARRIEKFDVVDRAWTELLPEAMRAAETRAVIKACYDQLLLLISTTLQRTHPDAPQARIADTAYAIACMAEHNYTFQRLGYPRARCDGLRHAALTLAQQLGSSPVSSADQGHVGS